MHGASKKVLISIMLTTALAPTTRLGHSKEEVVCGRVLATSVSETVSCDFGLRRIKFSKIKLPPAMTETTASS